MRRRSSFVARGGTAALRLLALAGIGFLAGCGSSGEGSSASATSEAGSHPTLRGHLAFLVSVAPAPASVVYVAPLDGSSPPHLIATAGSAFHPRFSRDGTRIYYTSAAGSGATIRSVAVDGTNDHLVFACANSCNCLGEDQTGRVFVWSGQLDLEGTLGTLGAGEGGAATLVPWSASPACAGDSNLDTAGDTIAVSADCTSPQLFVGGVAAAAPLTAHAFAGVLVPPNMHIQYAAGRVFARGWPPGGNERSAPLHVMSMAPDGSDVRDLGVGNDFVVSDDAAFVLASQQNSYLDGGATYAIVAKVGGATTPIPGLDAISSSEVVTLAWTPH